MKHAKDPAARHAIGVTGEPGQEVTLALSGRLALDNLSALQAELEARLEQLRPAGLTVDLADLSYLDSAGALALIQLQSASRARAIPCRFLHLSEEARRILDLIDPETLTRPPLIPEQRTIGLMDQLGEASLRFARDLVQVITFLGDLLTSLGYALLHPHSVRWGDVLFYMKRAGVDGLPIIGLIGLLLGLILAFMSSLQLKQFGANILRGLAAGRGHSPGTGPHHDRHPGGRPLRLGLRRRDRHHESQ